MTIEEAKQYVKIFDTAEGPRIWLIIGNQQFELQHEPENREMADWYAEMLASALCKIVDDQTLQKRVPRSVSACGGCSPESTSDYAECEWCRFNPSRKEEPE